MGAIARRGSGAMGHAAADGEVNRKEHIGQKVVGWASPVVPADHDTFTSAGFHSENVLNRPGWWWARGMTADSRLP